MNYKNIVIVLFLLIFAVSSFNSVSAASVNINSTEWSNNDITNFFNGNIVHGFNILDFDNVIFSEGIYTNLSFVVKNSVNIFSDGIVNFVSNSNLTAIIVNNTNNVNISGINFNNYSTAISFNNSNNSKVFNNTINNTINRNTSGIAYNNSENAIVENNTLNNNATFNSNSIGVYFDNSNGNITNNRISGYGMVQFYRIQINQM